jgi:hypothetical protein
MNETIQPDIDESMGIPPKSQLPKMCYERVKAIADALLSIPS